MKVELLLTHPAVQAIGWALLDFIWQAAILAALLFVTNLMTRRRNARVRYALACAAMGLMPLLLGTTILERAGTEAPAVQPAIQSAAVGAPATALTISPQIPPQDALVRFLPRRLDALPGWVACFWVCGVLALSGYTVCGWLRIRRLKRRHLAPPDPRWDALVKDLVRRLHISRPVSLIRSTAIEVPAVIGWLRPYILLPVSAVTGLSEAQFRAILAHELAHVRRHDYLVNVLQTMIETLLFYHPAVWWVSGRIRAEREHCCDDVAVSMCGDVKIYVNALARLEELRSPEPAAGCAATGGDLLGRIRRLLGDSAPPRFPAASFAAVAIVLVLGATLGLHAQQVPPPKFDVVSVKPCDGHTLPQGARSGPLTATAGRFSAECMTLQSLIRMSYVDFEGGKHTGAAIFLTPIEGIPDWTRNARYTIEARTDTPETSAMMRGPMLQSILEERFGIKAHYETREIPIYELVTDKAGFRLHPAAKGSCTPRDPATMGHAPPKLGPGEPPYCGQSYFKQSGLDITVDLRSMTLEEFAGWLLHGTDRLIYDKTGIQDKYDFHLEYSVDETMARFRYAEPGAIAEFPSLANALQKFGLKLVPGKGPGRFLRIDHVERPSEN